MPKSKNGINGKWHNINVIKGYELMKSGHNEREVADMLGVHPQTIRTWITNRPFFALAVREGRKAAVGGNDAETFEEYIYKRLPPDKRRVWDELQRFEKEKTGVAKMEALLHKKGIRVRQYLFIHAWVCSLFNTSLAMRKLNISRAVFNNWKNNDPVFAGMLDDVVFYQKDFFKSHLFMSVASGDTASTIFANRTFNKEEFGDKTEININRNTTVNLNVIKIGDLDLSLEVKKTVLEAIRKRKQITSKEVERKEVYDG